MALNPSGTTTTYSPGTAGTAEAVVADDRRTMLLNRAAWGAVFAGIATALVIQLLLNILGLGVGASSLDASNAADNPTASGFSLAAGIWWTISGIIASFVGGAIAGRLCGSSNVNTARWHGFVSWAATTLVVFYLLTSAVGGILGSTFSALGSTLGGGPSRSWGLPPMRRIGPGRKTPQNRLDSRVMMPVLWRPPNFWTVPYAQALMTVHRPVQTHGPYRYGSGEA